MFLINIIGIIVKESFTNEKNEGLVYMSQCQRGVFTILVIYIIPPYNLYNIYIYIRLYMCVCLYIIYIIRLLHTHKTLYLLVQKFTRVSSSLTITSTTDTEGQ